MGEVYRARDERLNRSVAIKALASTVAQEPRWRARFEREARVLGSLNHPNVGGIHDLLDAAGGTYLVLEYIEGQDLAEKLRAGPLPLAEAVRIGQAIASALQAAHAIGIVHRDLKPANIRLTPDGRVKLVDFGVALSVVDATPPDVRLGADGTAARTLVAGTPAYMSPEQASGRPVDHRSDLWAVGCVLYELVTGRRAFPSATLRAVADPVAPAIADWTLLPHDTPAAFVTLLRRCLDPDPGARVADASELRRTLDAIAEATVRDVAPVARKWPARVMPLTVVLALSLVLVILAPRLWEAERSTDATTTAAPAAAPMRSVAILPFATTGGNAATEYRGPGLADALILRLHRLPRITVRPSSAVFSFGDRDRDPVAFGRALGVEAVVHGSIREEAGRLRVDARLLRTADGAVLWAEQFEEAAGAWFAIEDSMATRLVSSLTVTLTGSERQALATRGTAVAAAHDAYLRGRYIWNRRSADTLPEAVALHERAVRLDPSYALAHAGLADAYVTLSGYHQASQHEMIPRARAAAERAVELDPTLAQPYTTLALIAMNYDWAWAEAERLYQRAIDLNPNYATAHAWYGEYLAFMGRFDEGLARFARARELDPLSISIATDVGKALFLARRFEDAIVHLNAVLEVEPKYVMARVWRGGAYFQLGRFEEAAADMTSREFTLGEESWLASSVAIFARTGRTAMAHEYLQQLVARAETTYLSPWFPAHAYAQVGDMDRAFQWLERLCDERAPGVIGFKLDPSFDLFRGDPRFPALLRRVGFAQP